MVNGPDAAVRVMSLPPVPLEHKVNKPAVEGERGEGEGEEGEEKRQRVRVCGSPLRGRRNYGLAASLSCT